MIEIKEYDFSKIKPKQDKTKVVKYFTFEKIKINKKQNKSELNNRKNQNS